MIKIPQDMQVGTIHESNSCGALEIIEYMHAKDVNVRFINTGFVLSTAAQSIRNGLVRDALFPSVYGVGFVGDGYHTASEGGKKHTRAYAIWHGMLQRCYEKKCQLRNPTYIDCSVATIWHNFQNFAAWFDDNYIDGYHLDKDLKVKGNKIYSPDTCLFVPQQLNNLFLDHAISRGEYPVGVCFYNREKKFSAEISYNGKRAKLGLFSTQEEASKTYQLARLNKINSIIESNMYGSYLTKFIGQHV